MCRKREARKELENFLTYIGGCIQKNGISPIDVVFTVERYEDILEEYSFHVHGDEDEEIR